MKTIKTLLLAGMTVFMLTVPTSCTDYQDEIDALDVRVTYLESLASKVNDNLVSLEKILNTLNNSGYITGVTPTADGYIINVEWITKGTDGNVIITKESLIIHDGEMPDITVEKNPSDGNFYWKINGEWLKDSDDNLVRANGVTPQVRINPTTNHWEISSDEGKTWKDTGINATGDRGENGKTHVRVIQVNFDENWAELEIPGQGRVKVTINIPS